MAPALLDSLVKVSAAVAELAGLFGRPWVIKGFHGPGTASPPRGRSDRKGALRQLRGRERPRRPPAVVRQRHIWANVSGASLLSGHDRCAQNYHRALRGRRRGAPTFPYRSARRGETIASPHRATLRLWRDERGVALRDGILRWLQPGRLRSAKRGAAGAGKRIVSRDRRQPAEPGELRGAIAGESAAAVPGCARAVAGEGPQESVRYCGGCVQGA